MSKGWFRCLLFGAAIVLLGSVSTTEAKFYVGASVGDSAVEVDSISFDESDFGYKIWGGFTFLKFLGIEASYLDLGAPEASGLKAEVTGWDAELVGILPLGKRFELFAQVGYVLWDVDLEASAPQFSGSSSEDGSDLIYGVGAAYTFGSHFGLRFEYELIDIDLTDDVTFISLGAHWKF